MVVMDELHMLDDEHRGHLLELMATKLLSLGPSMQLVDMSAKLNVSFMAWVVLFLTRLLECKASG